MKSVRCKIVGVGERRKGVGASGKPYDFVEVCFTYPAKKYAGVGCGVCKIDGGDLDEFRIVPGCELNVFIGHAKVSEFEYKPYIIGICGRV